MAAASALNTSYGGRQPRVPNTDAAVTAARGSTWQMMAASLRASKAPRLREVTADSEGHVSRSRAICGERMQGR